MKKVLLISFLILSLLVSCATKSVASVGEVSQENVTATVVDDFSSASVEQVPAVEIPESAPAIELASEEIDVKEEPPMTEGAPIAEMPEAEAEEPVSDDSWMYAPIAEAPVEDTMTSDVPTIEASVARSSGEDEAFLVEHDIAAVEGPSADEDVSAMVEGEAEMSGSFGASVESPDAPATVESAVGQRASQAELQGRGGEGPAAVSPSFVDRSVGFFKMIGQFIAEQTLLSVGLLVDLIGMVYLITVLVRTGSRRKAVRHEDLDSDVDPSGADDENTAPHAELSDEDEFLRNLLGE